MRACPMALPPLTSQADMKPKVSSMRDRKPLLLLCALRSRQLYASRLQHGILSKKFRDRKHNGIHRCNNRLRKCTSWWTMLNVRPMQMQVLIDTPLTDNGLFNRQHENPLIYAGREGR